MAASRIRAFLPQLREIVSRGAGQTSDRDLLRRFSAEADEDAFAEIVRRHSPMLLGVCRRILHNAHDAEDVAQAAFLLLARKVTSVGWHDSIAGWLYQTAYRLAHKARLAAGRRAHHEGRARPGKTADPIAELSVRELQSLLDEELSRLPETYRAPILLCCLEGRSRDEAAGCLGWELATVKDRLERGRERLRQRLAKRGVLLGTALTSTWLLEGVASAGLPAQATAGAALLLASGQATLAGLLPPRVAALVKGGMTTMLLCRVTMVAAGLALGLGATVALTKPADDAPPAPQQKPPAKRAAAAAKPAPAADGLVRPESLPLLGHRGAVHAIAFGQAGKVVATAGADGTVRIWDASTGVQLHKLDQPGKLVGLAFSLDGRTLAASSTGKGATVILWNAGTGKPLWRYAGGFRPNPAGRGGAGVAFSPDGRRLVAGEGGATVMFDVATGKMLFSFRGAGGGASAVAFSPDGKIVAMGDSGGGAHLLDPLSGRLVRSWRGRDAITALAYSPSGRRIAAADGRKAVRLLDVVTGKETESFENKETVKALAFSADGKRVATGGAGGTVLLWDAAGKQERQFFAGGALEGLAFSPQGKRLATAGADGAVLWDLTRDEKPLPADFKLAEKDLPRLWADLASEDGGKVYAAARQLRADPARSLPFLQTHLKSKAAGPDQKKLKKLIADLDSDEFKTREAASKELEKLGAVAESAMRDALAAGPSLEVKRRLEGLLKLLGGEGKALTAQQQRDVRAVRLLEQVGTPQAKKLLEGLSKESPGWWVMQEAKAALERLAKRDKKP